MDRPEHASTSREWRDLIRKTKVRDLLELKTKTDIITLKKSTTIRQASKELATANILSAPVLDDEGQTILGLIDVLDIVGFVVSQWRFYSQKYDSEHFPSSKFFDEPISKIINFSKVDSTFCITEESNLEELLEAFVNPIGTARLHRVIVISEPNKISGIISQSDLTSFIRRHFNLSGMDKKIGELGLIKVTVMAKADDPANKVLELMYDHRISSVALVDSSYNLVGSLNASDFRGFSPTSFDYFIMTAIQMSQKTKLCKVSHNATFHELINALGRDHSHRAYIVGDQDRINGVITLTDVLRYVLHEAKTEKD